MSTRSSSKYPTAAYSSIQAPAPEAASQLEAPIPMPVPPSSDGTISDHEDHDYDKPEFDEVEAAHALVALGREDASLASK